MAQLDLFPDVEEKPVSLAPSVASVRARIEAVLAQLRNATPAWSAKETAKWKMVIPQMADWLPPEEGDAARAEFAALMRRLETP